MSPLSFDEAAVLVSLMDKDAQAELIRTLPPNQYEVFIYELEKVAKKRGNHFAWVYALHLCSWMKP